MANQLEDVLNKFLETKDNQDFAKLMETLEKSLVLIPAFPPRVVSEEEKNAIKSGKTIPIDPKNQPQICLLGKNDGGKIFPIFTSREQIPKEKMPPVIMTAPFAAVISMMNSNHDKVKEIIVNPFTKGVVLNEKVIEVASKRFDQVMQHARAKASGDGPSTVQLTEKQFHIMAHNRVAREVLPGIFFKNPANAVNELKLKKEDMVVQAYKTVYPAELVCPYTADDLAVMMLQIDDKLLVIRIDMPEANLAQGGPSKVYITYEGESTIRYFIVEKSGKDYVPNIAEVTSAGEYSVIMEAPDNGVEIETIISQVRPS